MSGERNKNRKRARAQAGDGGQDRPGQAERRKRREERQRFLEGEPGRGRQRPRGHERDRRRDEAGDHSNRQPIDVAAPDFVFFHIGKTGGGSVRQFLAPLRHSWAGAGHQFDLEKVSEKWPGAPVVFFVREPLSRFVSGFNNYRRAAEQKDKRPNTRDIIVYNIFPTANDLAEALTSDDEFTLSAAHWAMSRLGFIARHLTANLGSPDNVDRHRDHIAFIGNFEDFVNSVEAMRAVLHLPPYLELPDDDRKAHRAPAKLPTYLSDTARAVLTDWYRADIELYEHCIGIHHEQMAALGRG